MKANIEKIKKLTAVSIFMALSYASVVFIRFPVSFLTFDIKDVFMAVCAMIYGPAAGFAMCLIVPLIEMITVSGTEFYGFVMNAAASLAFVMPVAFTYKYRKSLAGAVSGLTAGIVLMTVLMLALNLVITPLYLNTTSKEVLAMIPALLLPFNIIKTVFNAAIVMFIFKPVTELLKKTGYADAYFIVDDQKSRKIVPLAVTFISFAVIVAALVVFITVLGGGVDFGPKSS